MAADFNRLFSVFDNRKMVEANLAQTSQDRHAMYMMDTFVSTLQRYNFSTCSTLFMVEGCSAAATTAVLDYCTYVLLSIG